MNKYLVGVVALAAFLSVEFFGASQADAQGRLLNRMRGRFNRTQCCQVTCPTTTCATPTVAVGCPEPIVASPVVVSDAGCGDCGNVVACSACCPRPQRGIIARASYVSPACCNQVVSCAQTACEGCAMATGCGAATVEGCAGAGCGGAGCGGTIIEGEVIHGEVIESSEITAPTEAGSVPDPPAQAPEPTEADKDA